MNELYYLEIERYRTPKLLKAKKCQDSKDSKFYRNGTFDFLTSCHKIKFDEQYSTCIFLIVYFLPKILVPFRSVESFYPIYLLAYGNIIWKLGKRTFDTQAAC